MKKILLLILSFCAFAQTVQGDITWSSPVSISTASINASDPHVIIDSNGNSTAAWVENNIIKAASLPFGGSWTTPVSISNVSNTSSKPKLGIDSSGNVTAIWIENSILNTATLPFGGSWSSGAAISGSGITEFAFDVDATNNVVAVWVRSGNIEASSRQTGTWSLVSTLSTITSTAPDVKISGNGKAIAVWHSVSSGSDIIVSDLLTINTNTWEATKTVTPAVPALHLNYPKVAIDSNGNATVVAYRYNYNSITGAYSNVQVLASTLSNGAAAWSLLPTVLSSNGIGDPANLNIKIKADVNGDILAVWTNLYDGMTYSIESANKIFGADWPIAIIPGNITIYSFGFDIASSIGSALLVNMSWDGVSNIMISSQETDTTDPLLQGWTNISQFSTGSSNAFPACALNVTSSQVNGVAVWVNYNGINTTINASSGSDLVIPAPTSLTASQNSTNFGVFTEYYNTLTWDASSDPNILQYNLYRNGSFFASTAPDTLTFVDHNQLQSGIGTVVYGVSALVADFRQSAMVTFTLP